MLEFPYFCRKSISLTTTVKTDFGPEVEVTAFLGMHKEKWLLVYKQIC